MIIHTAITTALLCITWITCEQPAPSSHLLSQGFIESPLIGNWVPIQGVLPTVGRAFGYNQKSFPEPPYAFLGEPSLLISRTNQNQEKNYENPLITSQPEEQVQVLYVPLNSIKRQTKYPNFTPPSPRAINDFYLSSTSIPTFTTTPPPTSKPKPHQPPLALFMVNDYQSAEPLNTLLNKLTRANTIQVLDNLSLKKPEIFVGPSGLKVSPEYLKFDLPYLSNIERNRVERKIEHIPFFVAPLSYNEPHGYTKIAFPSPHVGSIVVRSFHFDRESVLKPRNNIVPISHAAFLPHLVQNNFSSVEHYNKHNVAEKNPLIKHNEKIINDNISLKTLHNGSLNDDRKLRAGSQNTYPRDPLTYSLESVQQYYSRIKQTTPSDAYHINEYNVTPTPTQFATSNIRQNYNDDRDHESLSPAVNSNQNTTPSKYFLEDVNKQIIPNTYKSDIMKTENVKNIEHHFIPHSFNRHVPQTTTNLLARNQYQLNDKKLEYNNEEKTVYDHFNQPANITATDTKPLDNQKYVVNKTDLKNVLYDNRSPEKNTELFISNGQYFIDITTLRTPSYLSNERIESKLEKNNTQNQSPFAQDSSTMKKEYSIIDQYNEQYNKAYEILSRTGSPSQTTSKMPETNSYANRNADQIPAKHLVETHSTDYQFKTTTEKITQGHKQRGSQTFHDTLMKDYVDSVQDAYIDINKSPDNYKFSSPELRARSKQMISSTTIKYTLPPKLPQISETLPGLINSLQDGIKVSDVITTSTPLTTVALHARKVTSRARRPVTVTNNRESSRRQVHRRPTYKIRTTTEISASKAPYVRTQSRYNNNNNKHSSEVLIESQKKIQTRQRNRIRTRPVVVRSKSNVEELPNYPQKVIPSIASFIDTDQVIKDTEPLYANPDVRVIDHNHDKVQNYAENLHTSNQFSDSNTSAPKALGDNYDKAHLEENGQHSELKTENSQATTLTPTTVNHRDFNVDSDGNKFSSLNYESTTSNSEINLRYISKSHHSYYTSTQKPKAYRIRGKMRKPTSATTERIKNDIQLTNVNDNTKSNEALEQFLHNNTFRISVASDDQNNYESIQHAHYIKLETEKIDNNPTTESNSVKVLVKENNNAFEDDKLLIKDFNSTFANDKTTTSNAETKHKPLARRGYWRRVQKKTIHEDALEASESQNVQNTYVNKLQGLDDVKTKSDPDDSKIYKSVITESSTNVPNLSSTEIPDQDVITTVVNDLSTITAASDMQSTSTSQPSTVMQDYQTEDINKLINNSSTSDTDHTTQQSILNVEFFRTSPKIMTSTIVTHETEMCYRGRCIKNPKIQMQP